MKAKRLRLNFLTPFLLLTGLGSGTLTLAQSKSTGAGRPAKTGGLPSQSVREVKLCFPQMDIGELLKSSSLTTLKEMFDHQSIVLRKDLRTRVILFRENEGEPLKRLRVASQKNEKGKFEYVMMLQKLDAEGVATDLPVPADQKINPKPSMINSYIASAEILEDEREFSESTKDGHFILSKFRKDELFSLDIRKTLLGGSLYCERKDATAIYCACEGK